ncbi:MAG: hypothetical protein PVI26_04325 [Chitinispirillia bacterium]
MGILFVLTIRGCYEGNYIANGKEVDNVSVAWHISKVAFHIIAYGSILFTILLSMNIISYDKESGLMTLYLSKPVLRIEYLFGKIFGIWIHSFLFMFILHCTIFFIVWNKTGGMISGYILASLTCAVNLLFFVVYVCFFSLFMPGFISAISAAGIAGLSFFSDSVFKLMGSEMVKQAFQIETEKDIALWRILFPKISMLQYYADSLIGENKFNGMGYLHPIFNLLIYIGIGAVLISAIFNNKEI